MFYTKLAVKPSRSWHEENGVIHSSVISNTAKYVDWTKRLKGNGCYVSGEAERALSLLDSIPMSGVTEFVVFTRKLFPDNFCLNDALSGAEVYRTWEGCKLITPQVQLACLLCESFTKEKMEMMGLSHVVVMHKPLKPFIESDRDSYLLHVESYDNGLGLGAYVVGSDKWFPPDCGFVFEVAPNNS